MDAGGWPWQRVAVVGTSSAGKSWLAAVLACELSVPNVQLDRLRGPNYPSWDEGYARRVGAATAPGARWVLEGADLSEPVLDAWRRADLIVFLDYRTGVVLARLVRVLLHGIVHGHAEGRVGRTRHLLRKMRRAAAMTRDLREVVPPLLDEAREHGVDVLRLRSRRELCHWLAAHLPVGAEQRYPRPVLSPGGTPLNPYQPARAGVLRLYF
jgi:adenylate kinase family enzyme